MIIIKKARNTVIFLLLAIVSFSCFSAYSIRAYIPDNITAVRGDTPSFARVPFVEIKIDPEEAVEADSSENKYTAWANILGVIPVKKVDIKFDEREAVILCAMPVGIKIYPDGVIVSETTDVITSTGCVNPGKECGLHPGDTIRKVNGKTVATAEDLLEAVESSGGKKIELSVSHADGKEEKILLEPAYSEADGCYRAGIWIRQSAAGIGVLTFCEEDNLACGGLGHAIYDEVSGAVLNISKGEIIDVMLTETVKGARGAPGELVGFLGETNYGTLRKNTELGIYGYLNERPKGELYDVALKQEIREGHAQIMANIPGGEGTQLYDIIIEKINYDSSNPTRNMIIHVTDEKLLDLTGGIVQGMSGSPIIQNGRFVAAATHVFVNDPSRGYAIFAENMIKSANNLPQPTNNVA